MSTTTVVNVKSGEFDVYIGRHVPRAKDPRCRKRGVFYNKFKVGRDARTAEEACVMFEQDLRWWLAREPSMVASLLALRGKRLGCWCHPDPCHGHVLVRVIEEFWEKAVRRG